MYWNSEKRGKVEICGRWLKEKVMRNFGRWRSHKMFRKQREIWNRWEMHHCLSRPQRGMDAPARRCTLFRITLFRITLFRITLFRITLFRITLFRITLFRIPLFSITLFRITLFRITLFRITLSYRYLLSFFSLSSCGERVLLPITRAVNNM